MVNETISDQNLVYISEDIYNYIAKYTISKDDLYITIAGTIGKVGMVPEKFDGMNLTENAAKITNIQIDRNYLLLLLRSELCRSQYENKTNCVAQPKLALERILSVVISVPPLQEQRRIADRLESLMACIPL